MDSPRDSEKGPGQAFLLLPKFLSTPPCVNSSLCEGLPPLLPPRHLADDGKEKGEADPDTPEGGRGLLSLSLPFHKCFPRTPACQPDNVLGTWESGEQQFSHFLEGWRGGVSVRGLYSGRWAEEVRDSCFLLGRRRETPSFLLQPTLFPTHRQDSRQ